MHSNLCMITLLQHLWMSCNDLFLRHKCNPAVAGEFFYARAQHLANVLDQKESRSATDTEDHDLPENLTVYEAASEHVTLLSLARAWFDGTHNEQVNQWSTLTEDRYAWRPEAILQDIDAKMLRSSVIAQSEAHNPTKQRKPPFFLSIHSLLTDVIMMIIHRGVWTKE